MLTFITAVSLVSWHPPLVFDEPGDEPAIECRAYPPDATQACRECMDAACEKFLKNMDDCDGGAACVATVQAIYQLDLILCSACNPVSQWGVLASVAPQLREDWVVALLFPHHGLSQSVGR